MSSILQSGSRIALIAMLSATPVALLAQSATTTPPAAGTATEKPIEGTAGVPAGEAPAGTMAQDPAAVVPAETMTTEPRAEMPPEEQPAKPVEGQIRMQSPDTVLAKDLIGSRVYSADGESIGEINDMIVNLDGTVDGIVIGVGGFLGIGEKDVAIEMDSLSTTTDEAGNTRLMTSATEADLKAAEEFITADEQRAAQRTMEAAPAGDPMRPVDPNAPVPGTAPATK